jgi:hypothetical protein
MNKYVIEKSSEWVACIIILPIAVYFAYLSITSMIEPDYGNIYGEIANIGGLALAGLLFYAGLYPARPWRNEPLKLFLTYFTFVICFVGLLLGFNWAMITLVKLCFGSKILESKLVVAVLFILSIALIIYVTDKFSQFSKKRKKRDNNID